MRPVRSSSLHKKIRDQVAGNDKEHIDTDVPSAEKANVRMVKDDGEHGDGSQALYIASKSPT